MTLTENTHTHTHTYIYYYGLHKEVYDTKHTTNKLPMTKVEGSLFGIYTDFTMVHINIYYTVWADHVNGSVSGIAFLNFESTRVLVVPLLFDWKRISLSMLRPLNHP